MKIMDLHGKEFDTVKLQENLEKLIRHSQPVGPMSRNRQIEAVRQAVRFIEQREIQVAQREEQMQELEVGYVVLEATAVRKFTGGYTDYRVVGTPDLMDPILSEAEATLGSLIEALDSVEPGTSYVLGLVRLVKL